MAEKLYLVNLSLIISHEIDSAFWHEWEMFNLPGGIQFFNILNFLLIMIFIYGFSFVIKMQKKGFVYSVILSIVGMSAFIIHIVFILAGYEQFIIPVSVIILLSCFIISIGQFVYTIKHKKLYSKLSTPSL